jgi:hypothetical protein
MRDEPASSYHCLAGYEMNGKAVNVHSDSRLAGQKNMAKKSTVASCHINTLETPAILKNSMFLCMG